MAYSLEHHLPHQRKLQHGLFRHLSTDSTGRSVSQRETFQLKNCPHGCSEVYEEAECNAELLGGRNRVNFSTTTISAHSFPSVTCSSYRNCARRKAQRPDNSASSYDCQSNKMIRVCRTSNLYEGPLATELLPSLIKETNRMSLGRDLSNQSFLHLFSPPSPATFSSWPRKQRGSCRSACAPSPRWVRARTRLELLVLPTASLLLFLSNCTCSDSGIATGGAPRLAAAAPAHGGRV